MRKNTWMENKETPMRKKTKDEEQGNADERNETGEMVSGVEDNSVKEAIERENTTGKT